MNRKLLAFLAPFALLAPLLLAACAPGVLASILGIAAPVATAAIGVVDAQMQRAQALAPGLSPTRPDDAAQLAEIVARLDTLDRCDAAKNEALSTDAGPSDATRTTAALIDAAAALRGLVDAVNAAQPRPLPANVLPFVDAGSDGAL